MAHLLFRIGHLAGRHPWRLIASWVVIALTALVLAQTIGGEADETFRLPGSESQRAADLIEDRFPQETLYSANVILHDDDGLTSAAATRTIGDLVNDLAHNDDVLGVSDPYDPASRTISKDGTTAIVTIAYDKDQLGAADYDQAQADVKQVRDAGIQVEYDQGLGYEEAASEPSSEAYGIAVSIVILTIAFGTLVAVAMPIVVALTALLIGTSVITILSAPFSMPEIASIVAIMMGLGVGIDYSLFVLTRHRQNLATGMSVPDAVGRANATAGLAVLFAGTTVILAIVGLQVSGIPMLSMMGWATAVMVLTTMLAAVTLLPALLGAVGHNIDRLRVPFVRKRPVDNPASKSARWAAHVTRHPLVFGISTALVLAVLAIPVFSMRLGFPDAGNDGESTTTRQAYDLVADGYGEGTNGPFTVVLEGEDVANLGQLSQSVASGLEDVTGVASVGAPTVNEGGDVATIEVVPTTSPQDEDTSGLLNRFRATVLPAVEEQTGVNALVTGNTPLTDDVSSRLQDRMPWFLATVIGLSFIVLMIVFRSVWVPLKAAILNVLSVGAAYGVVVAVFQWGWFADLFGIDETVPIMPLAPMLMFAILFGLSMDYEVFLVSRIREQFLLHGDAHRAVIEGMRTTGRVITSAGLIMIAVFGAFILNPDVTTKMFGVGLSTAVLLDVTLVRMILVPAALSLLGARAWWLPAWLDRLLPTIDLESGEDEGEPATEEDSTRRSEHALS
jgi:RND superfamily putative drug exporter